MPLCRTADPCIHSHTPYMAAAWPLMPHEKGQRKGQTCEEDCSPAPALYMSSCRYCCCIDEDCKLLGLLGPKTDLLSDQLKNRGADLPAGLLEQLAEVWP